MYQGTRAGIAPCPWGVHDSAADCSESQVRQGLGSVDHASELRRLEFEVDMIRYGQYDGSGVGMG